MQRIEGAGLIATSFRSLPAFGLTRATTLAQAVEALARYSNACVLNGGTDLAAKFNEGYAPADMVCINAITSMKSVALRDGALVIGAGVTHYDGARHELVRSVLPGFAQAWARLANVRVRMSATIGGNVTARRTRYEAAILLSALGAQLQFATPQGEVSMACENIWSATLPQGALLYEIRIPLRDGLALDYERSMRPVMTQALALDAAGQGRLVTATEFTRPRVLDVEAAGGPPVYTPYAAGDPVAGDRYLNHVAQVFSVRQFERLQKS